MSVCRRFCAAVKGGVGGLAFTAATLYVATDITFSEAFAVYYSVIFFAVGLGLCALDLRRALGRRFTLLHHFSTVLIIASGMVCLSIRSALSRVFALQPDAEPMEVIADAAAGAVGSFGDLLTLSCSLCVRLLLNLILCLGLGLLFVSAFLASVFLLDYCFSISNSRVLRACGPRCLAFPSKRQIRHLLSGFLGVAVLNGIFLGLVLDRHAFIRRVSGEDADPRVDTGLDSATKHSPSVVSTDSSAPRVGAGAVYGEEGSSAMGEAVRAGRMTIIQLEDEPPGMQLANRYLYPVNAAVGAVIGWRMHSLGQRAEQESRPPAMFLARRDGFLGEDDEDDLEEGAE